jgi:hypothetical protein
MSNSLDDNVESFSISPDFYLNKAFVNACEALPQAITSDKRPEDGLMALIIAADLAENITIARGNLKEDDVDYKAAVEKKRVELGIDKLGVNDLDKLVNSAKLAHFKIRLLMQRAFESSTKDIELTM